LTLDLPIDNKPAITHLEQNDYNPQLHTTTLILSIETGRKHQIRKHLAGIDHPIVGDRLYGLANKDEPDAANLQLVASKLSFQCPFSLDTIKATINADDALAGYLPATTIE
jgi:tRNA pseudouridine32 synthase/23S rRNA pseudouridine746 synthase